MNTYLPDDYRPLDEAETDRLIAILLTVDGKGREVKKAALERLVQDAADSATYLLLKHEGML